MYEIYEKLRDERGLTNYQISKATGIARATITEWSKGRYKLKIEKLKILADFFGVPVEYLMTGEMPNYYTNEETAKIAEEIFRNPNMRILFEASRDAKPEDLKYLADLAKRLKATNPDG